MVVRNVHEDELFKRFPRKCVVFTTIQMMSDHPTGYFRAYIIYKLDRCLAPLYKY